jgi:hypothetical protein
MRAGHTMTARGPASEPSRTTACLGPEGHLGDRPELFSLALVLPRSGSGSSRGRLVRLSGGDEETRTPDPLLAKEMLYQLSYVPVRSIVDEGWWAFLDSNQRPLPYQGSALTS